MTKLSLLAARHRHKPVTVHAVGQRSGIPYEVERVLCARCGETLEERPLRRAAA